MHNPFAIKIIDNGHTVQVNNNASTNTLEVDDVVFNFMQFHYHTHSEHAVDGAFYEMELHFVHQDPITKNLAVVGVFVETGETANPTLQQYINNFPAEQNKEITGSASINLSSLLPSSLKYYTYTGSLTTPPCGQGLKWMVLKTPIHASQAQIEAFEARHEINAREIQPLNNRIVLEQK